ncbi:MFS transporter [Pseudomonas sp. BP8]|uniref:MFS transporter n=1 Tax=Pseudomonas sp. BP8 TaxID=2817864 RepID=UPI001AE69F19|nr:MFS transporter [Pseudomonas sp. BP8]MBP2262828.1 sugar phosphate permease [Pseudomonas sp. BP8]HDS1735608.1 MFS transporter [Pseudomonas putida]
MKTGIDISEKPSRFRWVVAGLFFLVYTVASADRANLGVALPFIREEYPMTNAEAGALLSVFLLAYALAQIPSGFASSKWGVRKIFSFSMIATSILTGLMGTVSSVIGLKVCRFLLGIAEGPLPIGIAATINNWFPAKEKGTATGIFLAAVKFGPVLVPPLCVAIVAMWGWREIFYFFAIPGIVLAVMWYFMVANQPVESKFVNAKELEYITDEANNSITQQNTTVARDFKKLDKFIRVSPVTPINTSKELFRSWNIIGCSLGYSFQVGISMILLSWIPTYLVSVKNFSMMNMGFVAAAPWVGAIFGNLLGGILSDRVLGKRRKPGMMLSALATAGMMYALINSPNDPLLYAGLMFLTGTLISVGYSSYMVYPMGLASKKVFPVASSIVNTGGQLGGAAAPFLVGLLLDSYGWSQVFLCMAIASFVSFLILLTIKEPVPAASPVKDTSDEPVQQAQMKPSNS